MPVTEPRLEDWELVQRRNFNLIIANSGIPSVSGLEFARRVRNEGPRPLFVIAAKMIDLR